VKMSRLGRLWAEKSLWMSRMSLAWIFTNTMNRNLHLKFVER
jgi:hypothetical protein